MGSCKDCLVCELILQGENPIRIRTMIREQGSLWKEEGGPGLVDAYCGWAFLHLHGILSVADWMVDFYSEIGEEFPFDWEFYFSQVGGGS